MSAYSVKRSILNEQEIGEPLEQCRDLRADHSIRKSAMEKKDGRILAIASREIVTAEPCYTEHATRAILGLRQVPLGLPMAVVNR